MRRKLFFIVILLISLIFFLDALDINLTKNTEYLHWGEHANYQAKVVSISKEESEKYQMIVEIPSGTRVLLNYYDKIENYYQILGSEISFKATLENPKEQRNPGSFDYQKHLKSQGITKVAAISSFEKLNQSNNPYDILNKYLLSKKESFLNSINNEDVKGLISGILFGDKTLLDENIYDEFKINGTAHVLAVSGLHIGLVYAILEKLLGKIQTKTNFVIILICLGTFGTLASWTSSVTRAVGMILLKIIADYTDQRYDMLSAMSFIALILIINNPYVVFNISFQMSFLAVISIAFIMPHIPTRIPDFMAVTLAVNIGMSIYQIYQFNTFSMTSLFANIPIVYLISVLMPMAAIIFVVFLLGVNVHVFNVILESLGLLIIKINRIVSFGIDNLDIISPPTWLFVLLYAGLFFLSSECFIILQCRKEIKKIVMIFLGICCMSAMTFYITFEPISTDEIVFVDVGQGDCIHLSDNGRDVLIDGGGSISYNVGKNILKPYLLKTGVRNIDLAIATHLHTDHYKGLEELEEEGLIENMKTKLTAGETFLLSPKVRIETLWPLEDTNASDPDQDENQNCSVFMIHYEDTKILVTGDLDSVGEEKMMNYYSGTQVLDADILKIGHHGSHYSTSDKFLDEVSPKYCIIQVGKNNYGHPHMKTIEKIYKRGIMLLRTDINGAIGFSIDKNSVEYHTMIKDK